MKWYDNVLHCFDLYNMFCAVYGASKGRMVIFVTVAKGHHKLQAVLKQNYTTF